VLALNNIGRHIINGPVWFWDDLRLRSFLRIWIFWKLVRKFSFGIRILRDWCQWVITFYLQSTLTYRETFYTQKALALTGIAPEPGIPPHKMSVSSVELHTVGEENISVSVNYFCMYKVSWYLYGDIISAVNCKKRKIISL